MLHWNLRGWVNGVGKKSCGQRGGADRVGFKFLGGEVVSWVRGADWHSLYSLENHLTSLLNFPKKAKGRLTSSYSTLQIFLKPLVVLWNLQFGQNSSQSFLSHVPSNCLIYSLLYISPCTDQSTYFTLLSFSLDGISIETQDIHVQVLKLEM